MEDSLYRVLLRVSALTLAFVLLFQSGLLNPVTQELASNAGLYVANTIGMTAAVQPTELSTMTAELTKMQTDLEARERALAEREIEVALNGGGGVGDLSTFVLAGVLFILLVLILLNYVLDYLRGRRAETYEERPV